MAEFKFGTWYPIESAPKTGRVILAYAELYNYLGLVRMRRDGEWEAVDPLNKGMGFGFYPTHWMPLPDPPQ